MIMGLCDPLLIDGLLSILLMSEEYRRKYEDLHRMFRKQQQTVTKLQQEINERTRNYINHRSSKQGNRNEERQEHTPTKFYQPKEMVESGRNSERSKRVSKQGSECESVNLSKLSILDFDVLAEQSLREKQQRLRLTASTEMQFHKQYQSQGVKIDAEIIDGFKLRIAAIQRSKNEAVSELQKVTGQCRQLRWKFVEQQREIQKVVKSEGRLKQKLKKMPQYEEAIGQIYQRLKGKMGAGEQDQDGEVEVDAKIEHLLKWGEEFGVGRDDDKAKPQLQGAEQSNNEQEKKVKAEREDLEQSEVAYGMSAKKAWSTVKMPTWTIESQVKAVDDYKVSDFSAPRAEEHSIIHSLEEHNVCLQQQLAQLKHENAGIKQELAQSRKKLLGNRQSRLTKQIDQLKRELQVSKITNSSQLGDSRKMTVQQQLQPPYYVQEDMEVDTGHEYVKRSFVRKKIVRRNLSATAYRVVSKSKEEISAIIETKLQHGSERSKEKARQVGVKLTRQAKMEALKDSLRDVRVSQVSRESDSRMSGREGQQIRIVELRTTTPSEEVTSTKIYGKEKEETISFRRKW